MADLLSPNNTVTFTVKHLPHADAKRKTLVRLMQSQPEIRKGLRALQRQRRQRDNVTYQRAGKMWTHRKRATKLAWLEVGASFTLKVTPQIIPDIKSIERFVEMKAG